jgi:hypothetical protein
MSENYIDDGKKYGPDASEAAVASIVKERLASFRNHY